MTETVEQLKQRVMELRRAPSASNEYIDELNDLGWKLRFSNALLTGELGGEALQLATKNNYERGRAHAWKNIGSYQTMTDQHTLGEQSYEQSRLAFLKLSDKAGIALAVNGRGFAQKELGDYENATDSFSTALNLSEEIGNKSIIVRILNNFASVCDYLADHVQGLEYDYRALHNANEASPVIQSFLYGNIGNTFRQLDETEESISYSQQALAILKKHPNQRNESNTLVNLGAAYSIRKEYQLAFEYYHRGLDLARSCNHLRTVAEARLRIGCAHRETSDFVQASANLWQALQFSQEVENRFFESETLLELGMLSKEIGDWSESLELMHQALEISDKFNLNEIRYRTHLALSETYEKQQNWKAAFEHYRAFHRIWKQIRGGVAGRQLQRLLLQHKSSKPLSIKLKSIEDQGAAAKTSLSRRRSALTPRKLQCVAEFVEHHLEQNITVAELANVLALNEKYFSRVFKQSTGKTPHQFLIEQRVERAKNLLQTTNLPLPDIAFQCGFSSQSHLTAHFRLLTGATPNKFRRRSNGQAN